MSKGLRKTFAEISPTYELANHAMTLGLDILWRNKAANTASAEGGSRWLDVCTGTGEMANHLARRAQDCVTIVAADFSVPMMREATTKPQANHTTFVLADAKSLPFLDSTFDLVTTAFATRNLNVNRQLLVQAFAEFHRVLRPGGRYVSLETSQPPSRPVRKFFHLYVRLAVRPLGYTISRSRSGYGYLSYTIPRFYGAEDLAGILREASFTNVTYQRLLLGAVAIHKAVK